MKKYDYIIIGSGPAAYKFSEGMKKSQKTVLIVEGDSFGGICPNYGCEPKIFLEGSVKTVLMAKQLLGKGIKEVSTIDWEELIERKKQIFRAYPANSIKGFNGNNSDTLHGFAKFIDKNTIEVNGEKISGDNIIIATGQKPNKLPIEGKELTFSSNDVFDLDHLPKDVVFIGGGIVSMELAVVLNAAGSNVQVVEFAHRPLTAFSSNHVNAVVEEMESQGITFHFNQAVSKVEKIEEKYFVSTKQGLKIESDYVVDASGRVPNIDKLNLDVIGVKTDKGGIIVDKHLETNIKGIFAAGDVVSKNPTISPKLTSTAQFEGEYLSKYLLGKISDEILYPVIGSAVFTFPQVSQAGVLVDEARKSEEYKVIDYKLADYDFFYSGTNDYNAQLSLVFDKNNVLVGASEVSQTASDGINSFIHIIGLKLEEKEIKEKYLPVFPSIGYKIRDFL